MRSTRFSNSPIRETKGSALLATDLNALVVGCPYLQRKQWKTWNVGVKAVREFLGALADAGISKGIFITLCGYSAEAKQLAERHGIEIVNETGLGRMIEEAGARFDPETLAILGEKTKVVSEVRAGVGAADGDQG